MTARTCGTNKLQSVSVACFFATSGVGGKPQSSPLTILEVWHPTSLPPGFFFFSSTAPFFVLLLYKQIQQSLKNWLIQLHSPGHVSFLLNKERMWCSLSIKCPKGKGKVFVLKTLSTSFLYGVKKMFSLLWNYIGYGGGIFCEDQHMIRRGCWKWGKANLMAQISSQLSLLSHPWANTTRATTEFKRTLHSWKLLFLQYLRVCPLAKGHYNWNQHVCSSSTCLPGLQDSSAKWTVSTKETSISGPAVSMVAGWVVTGSFKHLF